MDEFHCKRTKISVYNIISFFSSLERHSHEIPVQLVCRHLLQQRLQSASEEHLEAEVVLNDQGGLQTTIDDLDIVHLSKYTTSSHYTDTQKKLIFSTVPAPDRLRGLSECLTSFQML